MQLVAGAVSGFLEAHPWKMTEGGGLALMIILICCQLASVVWCCANTASDHLKAALAIIIYACELISLCLIFASSFVAEQDLELSLMLAVKAADIMLWCAFVPMALMAHDNIFVPTYSMFIKSDVGTIETIYLIFVAAMFLPVRVLQALFGQIFSTVQADAIEVATAMDMVVGDTVATADEGGDE